MTEAEDTDPSVIVSGPGTVRMDFGGRRQLAHLLGEREDLAFQARRVASTWVQSFKRGSCDAGPHTLPEQGARERAACRLADVAISGPRPRHRHQDECVERMIADALATAGARGHPRDRRARAEGHRCGLGSRAAEHRPPGPRRRLRSGSRRPPPHESREPRSPGRRRHAAVGDRDAVVRAPPHELARVPGAPGHASDVGRAAPEATDVAVPGTSQRAHPDRCTTAPLTNPTTRGYARMARRRKPPLTRPRSVATGGSSRDTFICCTRGGRARW